MLRSMYAGISGMKGFQTKLDVIGNNIANVNTAGFKKGRVTFQDMMSQTSRAAQGPTNNRGGVNPAQVGLGSQLGSIDNIHTQGFLQTTDIPLDLAIDGEGMFIVASNIGRNGSDVGPITLSGGDSADIAYTRAGDFGLDENGNIVNPQGHYLVGLRADGTPGGDYTISNNEYVNLQIPDDAKSFSILSNGEVHYINEDDELVVAGKVALASFSNPAGLQKAGNNLYLNTDNAGLNTDAQGNMIPMEAESGNDTSIISGRLEMSNIDLAEEFTEMITAQRGFQANTRIITTSDEILQELVNLKR